RVDDGQWYLHLFDSTQPDLNWEHPQVHEEFLDVLRFWVDRGVDGFRVDVAHGLIKAAGLPDWEGEVVMAQGAQTTQRSMPDGPTQDMPMPMFDQDGVHQIYRQWRAYLDTLNPEVALVAEAWVEPLTRLARYVRHDEMQQAFNFSYLTAGWDAHRVKGVIEESLRSMGQVGAPATWVLSNHDVVRHASRFGLNGVVGRGPNGIFATDPQPDAVTGLRRAKAATLQMLGLPGSAYIYQGEELGLPEHTTMPNHYRQDPTYKRSQGNQAGRDGCRVPMPWDASQPSAGFSFGDEVDPWLPQPPEYAELAAHSQIGVEGTTFEFYQYTLDLRRRHQLGSGQMRWLTSIMDGQPRLVAFENNGVAVVTNYGVEPVTLPLSGAVVQSSAAIDSKQDHVVLPGEATIWVDSTNL
ncbi:MAG TPA: alpha-amylase family glycosyl hydrolase, partial [Beutenbergiaceae bacterium]|nr:alpha-amylase family glycosyl hydrolase [Beutenbergiaceae bacterium]